MKNLSMTRQNKLFRAKADEARSQIMSGIYDLERLTRHYKRLKRGYGYSEYIDALRFGMRSREHWRQARKMIGEMESMQQEIEDMCLQEIEDIAC